MSRCASLLSCLPFLSATTECTVSEKLDSLSLSAFFLFSWFISLFLISLSLSLTLGHSLSVSQDRQWACAAPASECRALQHGGLRPGSSACALPAGGHGPRNGGDPREVPPGHLRLHGPHWPVPERGETQGTAWDRGDAEGLSVALWSMSLAALLTTLASVHPRRWRMCLLFSVDEFICSSVSFLFPSSVHPASLNIPQNRGGQTTTLFRALCH